MITEKLEYSSKLEEVENSDLTNIELKEEDFEASVDDDELDNLKEQLNARKQRFQVFKADKLNIEGVKKPEEKSSGFELVAETVDVEVDDISELAKKAEAEQRRIDLEEQNRKERELLAEQQRLNEEKTKQLETEQKLQELQEKLSSKKKEGLLKKINRFLVMFRVRLFDLLKLLLNIIITIAIIITLYFIFDFAKPEIVAPFKPYMEMVIKYLLDIYWFLVDKFTKKGV